jgi:hypothetical protein
LRAAASRGTLLGVRSRLVVAAAAAAAPVVAVAAALAQSPSGGAPTGAMAALPGIPKDVAGFQRWTRMNFKPLPARGGEAHRGVKNVYVNRKRSVLVRAGKQRFPFPKGTIVVKTASTGGAITLVAIGRKRRAGFGGWQWVEYTRSSARERFAFLASGSVCTGCHVGAKKTDWIFTRIR